MKTKTETIKVCLFEGRHTLPGNQGPLFSGVDFKKMEGIKTPLYDRVLSLLRDPYGENEVRIYVTGFTPALVQLLAEYAQEGQNCWLNAYDAGNVQDELENVPYAKGTFSNKLILLHYNNETGDYVERRFPK